MGAKREDTKYENLIILLLRQNEDFTIKNQSRGLNQEDCRFKIT
jgi:hypothetical protein